MKYILAIIIIWNIIPHLILWSLEIPARQKRKASANFLNATWRGLIVLLPDLLAPIVVPIALLFTKWEDEKLPWLFTIWDNDLGPNGDPRRYDGTSFKFVPLEKDNEEVKRGCYWAKGHHPRSFWARYVWMGWRNRASKGAVMIGVKYQDVTPTAFGQETVDRYTNPGWRLTERGGNYQLEAIYKFGPLAYRMNYGFKVYQNRNGKIMPITISLSFKSWKGK